MNISSIVVQTNPEESTVLEGQLSCLPGVEVHTATQDGRLVVTIEDTPENDPANTLLKVQNMHGVLSAVLVYNYCDD